MNEAATPLAARPRRRIWSWTSDDGCVSLSTQGDALISHWKGALTLHNIRQYHATLERIFERAPAPLANFQVLDPRFPMPRRIEQATLVQYYKLQEPYLSATAVLSLDGVDAPEASLSSVLAMRLLSALSPQIRAFSNIEGAVRWLSKYHRRATTREVDEIALLSFMRTEFEPKTAPPAADSAARRRGGPLRRPNSERVRRPLAADARPARFASAVRPRVRSTPG